MHSQTFWSFIRNLVAQELYLHNGPDLTRPVSIHAMINERCNCRCRHCELWRMDEYTEEASIEKWKQGVLSIREFTGPCTVHFSGGEPLLKQGFIDLVRFCHEHDIGAAITTNGRLINEISASELIAAKPSCLNISVTSHLAAVHDRIRNVNGLFKIIRQGLGLIRSEQARQGVEFPVFIKTTVMSDNFRTLPELVSWAVEAGADGVSFQPLGRWSKETYRELWIGQTELPELEEMLTRLISMKHDGMPILNSDESLRLISAGFREESAFGSRFPCRIGLQQLYILPDGEVKLCPQLPGIGNIFTRSAREIWKNPRARVIRDASIRCKRHCLFTCRSDKTVGSRIGQAMAMLSGQQTGVPHSMNSHG
ncbi:MAG: radical SAM protein [Chlorobiaceae bacterium]|nr:radical SAM protein [Chlorobiaceae bacterium]